MDDGWNIVAETPATDRQKLMIYSRMLRERGKVKRWVRALTFLDASDLIGIIKRAEERAEKQSSEK